MNPIFVLVDFQQDFVNATGLVPAAGSAVERAARLLNQCRDARVPVVHVRTAVSRDRDRRMAHWKLAGLWKCEVGTAGYRPPDFLVERDGEPVVHKTGFSGFAGTTLGEECRNRGADAIILAGIHLHACVRQTAIDAYQAGMQVWIAADAVASDDPVHAAITRRYLEDRAVRFAPVDDLIKIMAGRPEPVVAPQRNSVRSAVDLAVRQSKPWRATQEQWRTDLVRELIGRLAEDKALLTQLNVNELGKPVRFSRVETERSIEMLWVINGRFSENAHEEPAGAATLRRRPHGTVAVITPFNNPIYIPLGKIVPAVLHGNAVVWKPAPEALGISRRICSLMKSAGWPDGLVSLLEGDRRIGQALLCDPQIDAVTITGSSAAGFAAQEACARRRIPLQAELGGNNAAVVWDDADLGEAARLVAAGAFEMGGQRCTANRRVIVHAGVRERFWDLLVSEARALAWGDPRREETRIGPLVSQQRCDLVAGMVERAAADCGPLFFPLGQDVPQPGPTPRFWSPPVMIRCEDSGLEIVQEETFGPVLVVQTARDWPHAMELCNGVGQGLSAAIFTRSRLVADRFFDEAQAGILKLNRSTSDAAVDVPFGGWKSSGLGPPEHGVFDLEFFTRPQTAYGSSQELPAP